VSGLIRLKKMQVEDMIVGTGFSAWLSHSHSKDIDWSRVLVVSHTTLYFAYVNFC